MPGVMGTDTHEAVSLSLKHTVAVSVSSDSDTASSVCSLSSAVMGNIQPVATDVVLI